MRKHFPKNNKYHKIFNLNTLKLSYCCTTNVGNIIKKHNSKVLSKTNDNSNRKCNCRSKLNCPVNGECLTQCLVYKATSTIFAYYGTSEGEFKTWYNNHTKSFRNRECMNESELSKHLWNLKDHGLDNNLSWEIHKKASPYKCGSKRCDLCLSQKVSIICPDPDTLLKKRTELISKCRHKNKFCWPTLRNNCHGMVLSICPNSLIKTQNKIDIFCAAVFC